MKGKWEKHEKNERTMKGIPVEADIEELRSGFWCTLTSFAIGRSDVVRNLEEHPYGIQNFTSFSRFCVGVVPPQSSEEKMKAACLVIPFIWYLHVVNHRRPGMIWCFFVRFIATLKMFWQLRPQCVSSSFTRENLPKQSLSHIGIPLGLALLLVNFFGQLIWLPDPTPSQWDLTQFHTLGRL